MCCARLEKTALSWNSDRTSVTMLCQACVVPGWRRQPSPGTRTEQVSHCCAKHVLCQAGEDSPLLEHRQNKCHTVVPSMCCAWLEKTAPSWNTDRTSVTMLCQSYVDNFAYGWLLHSKTFSLFFFHTRQMATSLDGKDRWPLFLTENNS